MILVYLSIAIVLIICLRMLTLSLLGAHAIKKLSLLDNIMECRNGRLSDAYNELGISMIVSGMEQREQLSSLLSLDINRYEVILIIDFTQNPHADSLLQDFEMIKVNKLPTRELSCMSVRGVYRSKQSNYSRLVVVDMNKGSNSQKFNCGANIARYEYVMALENTCTLAPGAVCSAVRTLLQNSEHDRVCAVGGFRVGRTPGNPLAFIDMSVKLVISGAAHSNLTYWGEDASVIFDREYLVAAGGYAVDVNYDYELFMRIKRMNERTKDSARSILMPKIFTHDSKTKSVRRNKCMFSTNFVFGFIFILALFGIMTSYSQLIVLTLVMIYLISIYIGVVCLCGTIKMYKYPNLLSLLLSSIFYPFYLIFRLIRSIRF